jgi:hypothetical protein
MANEQDLNSLDRFRKQPGRLVLEEHSHCEVPAGCGGVVLRWRNPAAGLPLTVYLYTPVAATWFLDGANPPTARVDLAPGRHLLAVEIPDADLSAGLLMFAATHDPGELQAALPTAFAEQPLRVLSADDATWKFSLNVTAADGWAGQAFDDRDWPALEMARRPQPGHPAPGYWQYQRCIQLGAVCLGLPGVAGAAQPAAWWRKLPGLRPRQAGPATGTVRVRKAFDVPPPRERDPR